jgi:magnesium chelatase family protein
MFATAQAAVLQGIDAIPVRVECFASRGLPKIVLTGLPDNSIREAVPRIFSAAKLCGIPFKLSKRIVINLVPGDLRKSGSAFDLPIALCMLASMELLDPLLLRGRLFLGELTLDGQLESVKGVLSLVAVKGENISEIVVPRKNVIQARAGTQLPVVAPDSLLQAVQYLQGKISADELAPVDVCAANNYCDNISGEFPDLTEVKGQASARRALEISAAGGHNLLMVGSPGSGKTMLARCLPGILPPIIHCERLEASRIHSVAGLLPQELPLLNQRPFRAPHATITDAGLVGSGRAPHVGEISLAHRGVLFLDEFPEFRRSVLEQLRQPLEDGIVQISRAGFQILLPARFSLVAAMNPCPCGNLGDPRRSCNCSAQQIFRYRARISGPILDRIDLQVHVASLPPEELLATSKAESSTVIRHRVLNAREKQRLRFGEISNAQCNAEISSKGVRMWCKLSTDAEDLLTRAVRKLNISARALNRILKVSRTISDLAGEDELKAVHLAEALQLRNDPLR